MSNKKTIYSVVALVLLFTVIIGMSYGYKLYKHERWQNSKIKELDATIQEQDAIIQALNSQISVLNEKINTENIDWNEDGYNYLAIGNSITLHGLTDYWWDNDRGMASSADDKDYVHLVESYLEANGKNVTKYVKNLAVWETNANDRAEFLELVDPYLDANVNLVTIQLGENASNLDTWESDFEELLSHVKKRCPNAQIIVVGDYWSNGDRDKEKQVATEKQGATYVSLDGIKDNIEYQAGLGTIVKGKDEKLHTIKHNGVAAHPGDKGMAAIADRIIEEIELSPN